MKPQNLHAFNAPEPAGCCLGSLTKHACVAATLLQRIVAGMGGKSLVSFGSWLPFIAEETMAPLGAPASIRVKFTRYSRSLSSAIRLSSRLVRSPGLAQYFGGHRQGASHYPPSSVIGRLRQS